MKRKTSIALLSCMTAFSSIAVVTGVLAWFEPRARIQSDDNEITGVSEGAYYESGDGSTPENAFVISRPRHLYNLAWLQYLGYYNKPAEKGKQYYFKLKNDIDMTGWTLPPIGTEEYPFIGNFNGQGFVVSNLNTTNQYSDFDRHPSKATSNYFNNAEHYPDVVGFFGVVGDINNDYTNSDGTTKTGMVYSSSVNEFKNTGLTNITVKTVSGSTLIGMAVGYVDAKVSNVAIDSGENNIVNSASAFDSDNLTENLSDYGVVGYASSNFKKNITKVTQNIYDINISSGYEFNATESGDSNGWGGSINMTDMYKRILSFRTSLGSTVSTFNYNETRQWNPEKSSYTITNNKSTSQSFVNYTSDKKVGTYSIGRRTDTNAYMYLNGGKYVTNNYLVYNNHNGRKITDGTNYLNVSSYTSNSSSNAGTFSNITNDTNNLATVWNIPTGNSGYIYTTACYNNSATPTTYYLYNDNGTLKLSASTSYRTTWTRTVSDAGKVRYSNGNYYLGFDGSNWGLLEIPTIPTEVTKPTEPSYSSYLSNSYQLFYINNGTNYYLSSNRSNNAKTSSTTDLSTPTVNYGWKFEYNNGETSLENIVGKSNVYIYTTNGNATYYLKDGSSNPYTYILVNAKSNAVKFSVTKNGDFYYFKNGNYYLCFNTTNRDFEDRTTQNGLYNTLSVKLTRTALQEDYEAKLKEYNDYKTALDTYETRLAATFNLVVGDPKNVEGPDTYIDSSQTKSGLEYSPDDTTYFPLNVVEDGSQTNVTKYYPKETNTGYITVGSSYTSSYTWANDDNTYYRRSSMRVSQYAISNINGSYTPSGGFKSIYTINESNEIEEITDSTEYAKYSDSLSSLGEILGKDSSYVYGLHFMNSRISVDSKVKAKYVLVNGVEHDNYELPVNSIDFNLKEKGYINLFAGMYFSGCDSLFSIHQVQRAGNNELNTIKKIEKIYSDGIQNHSVIYQYSDGLYSAGYSFNSSGQRTALIPGTNVDSMSESSLPNGFSYSLVFNTNRITNYNSSTGSIINSDFSNSNASVANAVFYFEMPMNAGEYCLGSVDGGTGGYLFYLDIGANAAKTQRTIVYEHFQEISKVFEYPIGVAIVKTSEANPSNNNFDSTNTSNAVIYSGYTGSLKITRTANDVEFDSGGGLTNAKPTLIGELMWDDTYQQYNIHAPDGGNNYTNLITPTSSITSDIRRLQYFDYNVNMDELTITIFTDVKKTGENNYTRTIVQKYADETEQTNINSMNVYNTTTGVKHSASELMNQNTIKTYSGNDESSVNTNLLTSFTYEIPDSITVDVSRLLEMDINELDLTGRYYVFQDWVFEIVPSGGDITIHVVKAGEKTVKIGNQTITGAGQEITVSAP